MRKYLKRITVYLATICLAALCWAYLQPLFFRIFPSDLQRPLVINQLLTQPNLPANVLLFGNSRSLFGINANILGGTFNKNGGQYHVVNLSGADQNIYESSYFYAKVSGQANMVVQFTTASFFAADAKHNIEDYKCVPMYLAGYRIDSATKQLLPAYNPYFDRPEFVNLFGARNYTRSYVLTALKSAFDNEPINQSLYLSPYFPHIFQLSKSPDYPVQKYNCNKFAPKNHPYHKLAFLKKASRYFSNKGIRYVIVLMPINADECRDAPTYATAFKSLIEAETGITVIDLTGFIPEPNYYYDAFHLNKSGAERVSAEVGKRLLPHLQLKEVSSLQSFK